MTRTLTPLHDEDVVQLFYAAVDLELPEDYVDMFQKELQLRGIDLHSQSILQKKE